MVENKETPATSDPCLNDMIKAWAAAVETAAGMVERRDERGFLPVMRRLREMYDRIQRCLPDPPDNRLPLVREAQAAISRWEAVEPAARAWLDEIRETALRYRTSREVVHTYRGSQPRRGRHIQLIARGDIHDDSR